jgi:hypothetical protein
MMLLVGLKGQNMEPSKLPFTLKVRRITSAPDGIDILCVVEDAGGTSLRTLPITVGPKTTTSGVCAVLQGYVDDLAKSLHKRGEAVMEQENEEEKETSLQELVGKEFIGGVAT